jgi:hypothetical protein
MVEHPYNPSAQEVEAGGLRTESSSTAWVTVTPCLKEKENQPTKNPKAIHLFTVFTLLCAYHSRLSKTYRTLPVPVS